MMIVQQQARHTPASGIRPRSVREQERLPHRATFFDGLMGLGSVAEGEDLADER